MNLENFKQAIEGQKTVIISHWTDGIYKHDKKTRQVEVSDLRILPTTKLIGYTFYNHARTCIDVLIRVTDVIEVCSVEEWNAGCDAFDALHDLVGLRDM